MTEINVLKKKLNHITQVETLVNAYGSKAIAGILGVSDRAIQLWISEPEREPRRETLKKIAELFSQHEAGVDIKNVINVDPYEYLIKNAIDTRATTRVILMALAEILAKMNNESVTKVLSELAKAVESEKEKNSIRS